MNGIKTLVTDRITEFRDRYNRVINYLRISLTDRCNLRCLYCMPEEGIPFIPHDEILTYEEILRIVTLCAGHGIRKVRLTGGEPLVRKGIIPFLKNLHTVKGLNEISITTNGVLLKELARPLRESGICRINVSMDTLKEDIFRSITRRDYFKRVWEGIDAAEAAGISPIKINVVAMKGINDDEIVDFAKITCSRPLHVRFIEMMPVGDKNTWSSDTFISINEIFDRIKQLGALRPVVSGILDGPARRYAFKGAKGEIGFIGAISKSFCNKCNRLRLTADGGLRGCLFSDKETDLKTVMRRGIEDIDLLELIRSAVLEKPANHGLNLYHQHKCVRSMNSIGG